MYDKKRDKDWRYKSINLFGEINCFPFWNGALHTTVNKEIQTTKFIIEESGLVGWGGVFQMEAVGVFFRWRSFIFKYGSVPHGGFWWWEDLEKNRWMGGMRPPPLMPPPPTIGNPACICYQNMHVNYFFMWTSHWKLRKVSAFVKFF